MFLLEDIHTVDTQGVDNEPFEMDIDPVQYPSPSTLDIQPITCAQRSSKNVTKQKKKVKTKPKTRLGLTTLNFK